MSKEKAKATDHRKPTGDGLVRVRLLCDSHFGVTNAVAEISEGDVTGAVAAGLADPSPDAVAYAESLAAPASEEQVLE